MKSINVLAITKSDLPDCTKSTHTGLVLEGAVLYCKAALSALEEYPALNVSCRHCS
jgi:hypothetical protein